MRFGMIIPPSIILSDERVMMHLGPLRVAAALEERGVLLDVLDLSGVRNYEETVAAYCASSRPTVLGLTATSPHLPSAVKIVKVVREKAPQARIILGGPHVTLVHAAYRREEAMGAPGRASRALSQLQELFDVLVAGDGEEAIFAALEVNSPKIIDADNPNSPLFLTPARLTQLPFPARHLVDVSSYHYFIDGVKTLSIIAQLGCPFRCGFCGGRESPFLRRVRLRSTESVIAEMRHIYERYSICGIMFYDDELNVNREMVRLMRAIAELGRELGIDWRLRGFVKAELFTDEQAEAMYAAGFREILCGFESGSPRILKNIEKQATREENTRCAAIARRHGLRVKALMSIGHPGESEETVRETKEWVLAMRPESFDLTRITVYPGTPYFDRAVPDSLEAVWVYTARNGDRLYSTEVDFLTNYLFYKGDRGDRMGLNNFFAYTDFLSVDELARLRDETERELREKLGQPYQTDVPGILFEHSMGQGLPDLLLRSTNTTA